MSRVQSLLINGTPRPVDAAPERPLLSVLRDDLGLTGAKYGCGQAQCGACVVLVAGEPLPACTLPVGEVENREISTIEGLARGEKLHPVQSAFVELGAMQCGYCTPGMIMETVALLREHPRPDDEAILAAMDRHICRCGAYALITAAVHRASDKMANAQTEARA